MFWGWLALATYKGNRTFHEVVYDEWEYIVSVLASEMIETLGTAIRVIRTHQYNIQYCH